MGSIELAANKKLSKRFNEILDRAANGMMTLKELPGVIHEMLQIGRSEGLTDIQIGDLLKIKLKGKVSHVTINKYLPQSAKHMQMCREIEENQEQIAKDLSQNNKTIKNAPTIYKDPKTGRNIKIPNPPSDLKEVEPSEFHDEPKTPEYKMPDEHIALPMKRKFSFLELDRARTFAKSNGFNYVEIGIKNGKIEIL